MASCAIKAVACSVLLAACGAAYCDEYITDQVIGVYGGNLLLKQVVEKVVDGSNYVIEAYFIEKRIDDGSVLWQKRVEEIRFENGRRKNVLQLYYEAYREKPYFLSGYDYPNQNLLDCFADGKLMVYVSEELWVPYDISEKITQLYSTGYPMRLVNSYRFADRYIFIMQIGIGAGTSVIYQKAIIVDAFEILEM